MNLTICRWHETTMDSTVVDDPTLIQIESAIRALNNADVNDLYLNSESNQDIWLAVAGGGGNYVVTGSKEQHVFQTLVNSARANSTELIFLIAGGQGADWRASDVVDFEVALRAATYFAVNEAFDTELEWRE